MKTSPHAWGRSPHTPTYCDYTEQPEVRTGRVGVTTPKQEVVLSCCKNNESFPLVINKLGCCCFKYLTSPPILWPYSPLLPIRHTIAPSGKKNERPHSNQNKQGHHPNRVSSVRLNNTNITDSEKVEHIVDHAHEQARINHPTALPPGEESETSQMNANERNAREEDGREDKTRDKGR